MPDLPPSRIDTAHHLQSDTAVPLGTPPAFSSRNPAALRILLVDDDSGFRHLYGLLLKRHGYQVLLADSSQSALALADQADVALVDMIMPGVDGLHTIPLLRGRNPSLKLLASSGSAEEKYRAQLDLLGVEQFLPRPFTMTELDTKIELLFS